MDIQREELQRVLQGKRRDPNIVAWNGPAFLSQIDIRFRISKRRLFRYTKDTNRSLTQELRQMFGILRTATSGPESTVQLALERILGVGHRSWCEIFAPSLMARGHAIPS